MKSQNIYLGILLFLVSLVFGGCKTADKVNLYAPANTTIYLPSSPNTAHCVANTAPVKIEIPGVDYYGYILAKDPSTGLKVPVGLDVRKKRYTGEKIALGTGYTLACAGAGTALIGSICMLAAACGEGTESDVVSTFGIVSGCGAGIALLGLGVGFPADARHKQLSHQYQFTYDKNQNVEFGSLSTKLLHPDAPKGVTQPEARPKRNKATTSDPEVDSKVSSTAASKSRGDKAKKISGSYKGSGKLIQGSEEVEFYTAVIVNIRRIDANKVEVSIIESGEEFFASPLVYDIINISDGQYTLVLDKMPSETIVIDKTGKLIFSHSKVNIDNEIYTLMIDCNKDK